MIIFEDGNPPDDFADSGYGFSEQYFLYAILDNGDLPASKFGEAVYSDFSRKHNTPFLRYADNHDIIADGMPAKCGDDNSNPHVKIKRRRNNFGITKKTRSITKFSACVAFYSI